MTSEQELKIENLVVELAELLDTKHGVNDEFYGVLVTSINKHAELIEEQ